MLRESAHLAARLQSAPSLALERVLSCAVTPTEILVGPTPRPTPVATPPPLDGAAATLALPLRDFLKRARGEVADLEEQYGQVLANFRDLMAFFAQPVPNESALRGQEPEQFLGNVWRLVERVEAAAKERGKVLECLHGGGGAAASGSDGVASTA